MVPFPESKPDDPLDELEEEELEDEELELELELDPAATIKSGQLELCWRFP